MSFLKWRGPFRRTLIAGLCTDKEIYQCSYRQSSRAGFTLIEVMLASAIVLFFVLALFEGLLFCRRSVEFNRDRLEADSLAWDILWETFSRPYNAISEYPGGAWFPRSDATDEERAQDERMLKLLAPSLKKVRYYKEVVKTVSENGLMGEARIVVNVAWQDRYGVAHTLWPLPEVNSTAEKTYPYQLIRTINTRSPILYSKTLNPSEL